MSGYSFNSVTPSYLRLIDAIQKRPKPIVAWIGAGLSAPAGLPSWRRLRDDLTNELAEMARVESGSRRLELRGRHSEIKKQADFWRAFGMLQSAT